MSTSAAVTPERIMQFAWGYIPTLVLEAAIHHRVFDVLDAGPKTLRRWRRRPARRSAGCGPL